MVELKEHMSEEALDILLVDDEPAHQALLSYHLKKAMPDANLHVTSTLQEAKTAILNGAPALALVDLNLPDGKGVELLLEDFVKDRFPIIILTSHGDEQAAVDALKTGAVDYVVKTDAAFDDISHTVERVLRDWANRLARKQAEEELRRSESKYRRLSQEFQTILEGIDDSIALIDQDYQLIWANQVAIDSAVPGREWQPGVKCFNLWQARSEVCAGCPVRKSFQTGHPAEEVMEYASGRIWAVRCFPLKDADKVVQSVIMLATDITEKMQLRAESMRSSQLAALGELAAGVGHEINNPLNGVINYAQLLLDISCKDEERELAQNIIDEGGRMAEIVSNLLTFSRKPPEEPDSLSLKDAMAGVLKLTEVKLRHDNIVLDLNFESDLPMITGNYQQLQQVLLNIITNASYALNQKYPDYDSRKIMRIDMQRFEDNGDIWLRTTVTDFGVGITPEILDKICDPFFTTKPQGSGTGLGMSISHGIVKTHNGRLLFRSSPGSWTKVVVDLPVS